MKSRARLAALALLAACGCAPLSEYAGPGPVPGVPGTTAANSLPAASRDESRLRYGELAGDAPRARAVLVYGDNRPGFRMQAQRWEHHSLKQFFSAPPMSVLRGLVALPLALVEAVVPVLNGPRDVVTTFSHRPTGGGERRVLRALEREPGADLVISTGDIVTSGLRARLWSDFASRARRLRERVPYLAAPGNHERIDDPRGRSGWNAVVMPPFSGERYWGYLDDPATGTRWVFLDSDVLTDPHGYRDPSHRRAESLAQLAWADSVLASPARHRFVVMHHPLVSAGHYETDWSREGEGQAAENRARLISMLLAHRVEAVFAGHEHLYQRLWVKGPEVGGFWHVTTGGGGSPLYLVDRAARERAWSEALPGGARVERGSERLMSEYHYGRLELPPAGDRGTLTFVVSKVTVGGKAIEVDRIDLSQAPGQTPGGK